MARTRILVGWHVVSCALVSSIFGACDLRKRLVYWMVETLCVVSAYLLKCLT